MAFSLVQSNHGNVTASATVNPAFTGASTTGNLVVLAFASDDYNGTADAGWTESTGMEQQTFHGGYVWWRISAGETSFTYTIGSATFSSWVLAEFSGNTATPYDISAGHFQQSSGPTSYTTQPITPTAGDRLIVGMIGTSMSGGAQGTPGTWTNSFINIAGDNNGTGTGGRDAVGMSYLLPTANGSTAYSTGASWAGSTQSQSGLTIAFIASAAAGAAPSPMQTFNPVPFMGGH